MSLARFQVLIIKASFTAGRTSKQIAIFYRGERVQAPISAHPTITLYLAIISSRSTSRSAEFTHGYGAD
jgi:hypothetical protein